MQTIQGTVKKIIYHSEQTGFCIFKFDIETDQIFPDIAMVKGTFFQIEEKDYFRLHGDYQTDPKYGREFVVDHYEACLPDRIDMLEQYLSSGLIKGIGPARAKAIIQHFGEKSMYILESEPERLTEISGIGTRMAELIGQRMKERGEMQEILLQLAHYGIGPTLGTKIYRRYGKVTLHTIQTNPYKLIADVRGVGFETADKIALENGVAPSSPYRIQSGIMYALEKACAFGSTYYPKEKLLPETAKLLGVPLDQVTPLLDQMIGREELRCEKGNRIYTVSAYTAETDAAYYLSSLVHQTTKRKFNAAIMTNLSSTLDDVQMSAVKTAAENNVMVLTGGPGVGKTTTTNLIIKYFEKEKKKIQLAAPTGRAAKRMKEATGRNAMTIHRLLEVTADGSGMMFQKDVSDPLSGDVIIIDEVSMMDIYLAQALFSAIKPGAQLILVGDKNQLPSVGAGNVLADIIASKICPVVELTKVYRQAEGSHIITNAHAILKQESLNLSNHSKDFFFKACEEPEQIREMLLHYVADSLPAFTGEKEIQVLAPIRGRYLGVNELNLALQNRLNPLGEREEAKGFREGDKVIQTVNDYNRAKKNGKKRELGVFNGDAGIVENIDFTDEYLYVRFEDDWLARYEFKELGDLSLSYALTIHKSQGSEYPVVVIPVFDYIPMLTTMNLLYTGVTRAKKAILIIGSKKKLYQIIHNVRANERYTGLKEALAKTKI